MNITEGTEKEEKKNEEYEDVDEENKIEFLEAKELVARERGLNNNNESHINQSTYDD